MNKNGTAKGEFMHESLEKDAVKYDLPSEEIISALAEDNKQLQAENEKLKEALQNIIISYERNRKAIWPQRLAK